MFAEKLRRNTLTGRWNPHHAEELQKTIPSYPRVLAVESVSGWPEVYALHPEVDRAVTGKPMNVVPLFEASTL